MGECHMRDKQQSKWEVGGDLNTKKTQQQAGRLGNNWPRAHERRLHACGVHNHITFLSCSVFHDLTTLFFLASASAPFLFETVLILSSLKNISQFIYLCSFFNLISISEFSNHRTFLFQFSIPQEARIKIAIFPFSKARLSLRPSLLWLCNPLGTSILTPNQRLNFLNQQDIEEWQKPDNIIGTSF